MIRQTFQLVSGVGPWREKDLWARDIRCWDDFPEESGEPVMSTRHDGLLRARIAEARQALARRDLGALAALVPAREHWRLYGEFSEQAAFFDIEAEGKSDPKPTVVSVFDRAGLHVFIAGRNLGELPAVLGRSPIWVTFNGTCYDVPVLRNHFGVLPAPTVHLDLRVVCRRIRLTGGLKGIEDRVGIGRPPHLKGVNGWDAALLWAEFIRTRDVEALRFLVEYNIYDTVNLRALMDRAYNRCAEDLSCDVPPIRVFDRGDVLYDISKLLLALGRTGEDQRVLERARRRAATRG